MLNHDLNLNEGIFTSHVDMKSTRDGFADGLLELVGKNPKVIALTADWAHASRIEPLAEKFPKQFVEVGIAEQNMAGIAAGLAMADKIPFIISAAIFNPGRNWEQIRLSICFSNLNVKVIATHAGLAHSFDGGQAQALEDVALTRVLPNMTVVCPIDYVEAKKAVAEIAKIDGPVYLRLGREETPVITTAETPFEIGKANVLAEGTDITFISMGSMGYEALTAAKELGGKHKVSVEVINCSTVKPLDARTILNSVKKTGYVITIEDHQIAGGLGSAIAELLGEELPTKMARIGVKDKFGESGKYNELKDKYGLSTHHIVSKALELTHK
jgi:transketolase